MIVAAGLVAFGPVGAAHADDNGSVGGGGNGAPGNGSDVPGVGSPRLATATATPLPSSGQDLSWPPGSGANSGGDGSDGTGSGPIVVPGGDQPPSTP
jgi:hypothetical protein